MSYGWCTTVWVIAVRKAQTCPRWCVLGRLLNHQKHRSALSSSSLSLSVTSFPCHLCSLTSSRTLYSRCLLRRFFTFFPGITSPSSVTQTGSGYWSCSCKPYSFTYATNSLVNAWWPTLSARSWKSRTIFIAGSLFWYRWLLLSFSFLYTLRGFDWVVAGNK